MFTVTEIAMENTGAVPPARPLLRTPKPAYPVLQRCGAPSVPLTCLARLAAWQSLCTGHVENPIALALTDHRQAVRPPSSVVSSLETIMRALKALFPPSAGRWAPSAVPR